MALEVKTLLDVSLSNVIAYGTNTGDGVVSGVGAAVDASTEVWTLTCTVAAVDGGTFSVSGSVSGAQADATVAIAYDNGLVKFTIADGLVDWVVGDTATITIGRTYISDYSAISTSINSYKTLVIETSGDLTEAVLDLQMSNGKYIVVSGVIVNSTDITNGGKVLTVTDTVQAKKLKLLTATFTSAMTLKVTAV